MRRCSWPVSLLRPSHQTNLWHSEAEEVSQPDMIPSSSARCTHALHTSRTWCVPVTYVHDVCIAHGSSKHRSCMLHDGYTGRRLLVKQAVPTACTSKEAKTSTSLSVASATRCARLHTPAVFEACVCSTFCVYICRYECECARGGCVMHEHSSVCPTLTEPASNHRESL